MKLPRVALLLGVFVFCCATVGADDQCSDVLRAGIYDKFHLSRSESYATALKRFLSSSDFQTYMKSQETGFGITIPFKVPVPINFNSNQDAYNQVSKNLSAMSDEQFSSELAESITVQLVSKAVVQAWLECVQLKEPREISGHSTISGDTIILELKWNPKSEADKPPVTKSFYYIGVQPVDNNKIVTGAEIPISGIMQAFKKTGSGEVTFGLSTTRGSWQSTIKGQEQKVTTELECKRHDEACLQKVIMTKLAKCSGDPRCEAKVRIYHMRVTTHWQMEDMEDAARKDPSKKPELDAFVRKWGIHALAAIDDPIPDAWLPPKAPGGF